MRRFCALIVLSSAAMAAALPPLARAQSGETVPSDPVGPSSAQSSAQAQGEAAAEAAADADAAASQAQAEAAEAADDTVGEDVVASIGEIVGSETLAGSPDEAPARMRIEWREDWPRFSFDEVVLSLGLGVLLVAAEALPTSTRSANWQGGIIFDDDVSNGLRLTTPQARESARVAAEVLTWVLIGFPFVVDALFTAGIVENNWDAMFQMGLIGLEAYVIALVVWKVTALLARRERPIAGDPAFAAEVSEDDVEATSFFSNQAVNSFTGAFLTCLHHTHMPLFDDEAADISACVGAITTASVVGLLRVMSYREYLTDVLAGAVVGFLAGYLVPWIVHYQGGARPELRPPPVAFIPAPMIGPGDTYGLIVAGWF
jgi:membrane-associated phospholipid phosphatase